MATAATCTQAAAHMAAAATMSTTATCKQAESLNASHEQKHTHFSTGDDEVEEVEDNFLIASTPTEESKSRETAKWKRLHKLEDNREEYDLFQAKRMKYETLLDGGMSVSIPATLCAAVALDLLGDPGLQADDTDATTVAYVSLVSIVAISSVANVALSMMLHCQAKLIFASHKLSMKMQCDEFELLWREFAKPRRYTREGFILSMPLFLVAMGFRPAVWSKPDRFAYAWLGVSILSFVIVLRWILLIDAYWAERLEIVAADHVVPDDHHDHDDQGRILTLSRPSMKTLRSRSVKSTQPKEEEIPIHELYRQSLNSKTVGKAYEASGGKE